MFFAPVNSYYKKILKLSLPAIAGLSTQMILSLVDTALVGRLENADYALAAMGFGVLATWALVSFFSSLATGTHVLIARKFGSKDYDGCGEILNNSLFVCFFIGIIVAVFALTAAHPFAQFFSADSTVGYYAGEFIFYRFLGLPFFLITVSYRGFFFGIGKTKIFMFSAIMVNILNIIFNYILIYGAFGLPKMGVAGSGLGSSLATVCDALFYFIITTRKSYRGQYNYFKGLKFNLSIIKEIYRISLPVSFQNVFILLGFLSFISISGLLGIKEQAASQGIFSTLFMSFLPCFGFGIAAQTLIGNSIGAGKKKLALIYGFETAKIATYYTLLLGLVFILFPDFILSIITTDQSIIEVARNGLRIAGFAQIFYATGVVLSNGLQAAGNTLFVMISEGATNLFLFVPLAYFIGKYLGFGFTGAWAALPSYIITYSAIIYWKFRFGRWKSDKAH